MCLKTISLRFCKSVSRKNLLTRCNIMETYWSTPTPQMHNRATQKDLNPLQETLPTGVSFTLQAGAREGRLS